MDLVVFFLNVFTRNHGWLTPKFSHPRLDHPGTTHHFSADFAGAQLPQLPWGTKVMSIDPPKKKRHRLLRHAARKNSRSLANLRTTGWMIQFDYHQENGKEGLVDRKSGSFQRLLEPFLENHGFQTDGFVLSDSLYLTFLSFFLELHLFEHPTLGMSIS